jgi:hypothetical protein
MRHDEPNPDEGQVEMHNGSTLFWKRNEAGGRTYTSDEIPPGVEVWDTCLTATATLCEAIAMEFALSCMERRAAERRERARTDKEFGQPHHGHSTVRPADDGPCPNCGALGCWIPCPYEPPLLTRIPEGVITFDGDTLPDELRPLTHRDVTLRVHLIRARDQLLRYSSEDPMAAELSRLLGEP